MGREIRLTGRIQAMLKKEFPHLYVQRVSDKFLSGLPDLRVICLGFSGDVEIKTSEKRSKPSAIQLKVHEWIRAAGGEVVVVRSVDEARAWAQEFSIKCSNRAKRI